MLTINRQDVEKIARKFFCLRLSQTYFNKNTLNQVIEPLFIQRLIRISKKTKNTLSEN